MFKKIWEWYWRHSPGETAEMQFFYNYNQVGLPNLCGKP
jgi:hypothetical protein